MKTEEYSPAFSMDFTHDGYKMNEGMTKLEAFTMAAMNGLCANTAMLTGKRDTISNEALGAIAVNIAKQTIEALNKEVDNV